MHGYLIPRALRILLSRDFILVPGSVCDVGLSWLTLVPSYRARLIKEKLVGISSFGTKIWWIDGKREGKGSKLKAFMFWESKMGWNGERGGKTQNQSWDEPCRLSNIIFALHNKDILFWLHR